MSAEELLAQLRAMLGDLTAYIEREAQDQAAQLIADAEARARLAIVEATGKTQRQQDLVAELRRRLQAADRRQDEMRRFHERLAAALGRHPGALPWTSLVAEIESVFSTSQQRGGEAR